VNCTSRRGKELREEHSAIFLLAIAAARGAFYISVTGKFGRWEAVIRAATHYEPEPVTEVELARIRTQ